MRMVFKCVAATWIALFGSAGMVVAQPMSPQMEGYINEEVLRRRNGGAAPQNTGPSASEVRAWHARERAVQGRIARYQATPYYAAIVFDFSDNKLQWAAGFKDKQKAVEKALGQCRGSNCRLVSVFSNTCAVLTTPVRGVRTQADLFLGFDGDDNKAAEKSIYMCEKENGRGNCLYSAVKTKHGTAFCTGYEYGLYNSRE